LKSWILFAFGTLRDILRLDVLQMGQVVTNGELVSVPPALPGPYFPVVVRCSESLFAVFSSSCHRLNSSRLGNLRFPALSLSNNFLSPAAGGGTPGFLTFFVHETSPCNWQSGTGI
jgi:hypothetical protein